MVYKPRIALELGVKLDVGAITTTAAVPHPIRARTMPRQADDEWS
jgi:hypothetical protein